MFCLAFCVSFAILYSAVCASEDTMTPECEEKETSFAILDLARDSIVKAKALRGDNATSIQCGRYEGYLNVAINLITDAKNRLETSPQIKSNEEPMDCMEVFENGKNRNAVYTIWPRSRLLSNRPIQVFCDMQTDGGAWTLIQRRGNFSKQEDFYMDWRKYKTGFGNIHGEFWIGNDNIFALSNQGLYRIRFDLQDVEGNKAFAVYDTFWIEGESNDYRLHIQNYSGNAGDAMAEHNLQKFSTLDKRNDLAPGEPCSAVRHGAWWYLNCAKANLNGLYQPGKKKDHKSVYWYFWKELDGLAAVEIKIKRK